MPPTTQYLTQRRNLLGMIRDARELQKSARAKNRGESKRLLAETIHGAQIHLAELRASRRRDEAEAVKLRASTMVEVHGSKSAAAAFARELASGGSREAQLYRAVAAHLEGA